MSSSSFDFSVDSAVWGEWVPGRWYPGRVTDAKGPFRFVQFDDGDQGWLDTWRLVASPDGPSPVLAPGIRVVAEWQPGAWYPGVIEEASDDLFFVQFDDGESGRYTRAQVRVGTGEPPVFRGEVTAGARVDARWRDGMWYPGVVTAIVGGDLRVDFDDGDISTIAPENARVRVPGGPNVERLEPRRVPDVSVPVLACAGPRTPWRPARVEAIADPLLDVRFPDDTQARVTLAWTAQLLDARPGVPPRFPPEGAAILAEWVPSRWYTGVMGRVVGSRGHVVYDDGTKAWVTPYMIAALFG